MNTFSYIRMLDSMANQLADQPLGSLIEAAVQPHHLTMKIAIKHHPMHQAIIARSALSLSTAIMGHALHFDGIIVYHETIVDGHTSRLLLILLLLVFLPEHPSTIFKHLLAWTILPTKKISFTPRSYWKWRDLVCVLDRVRRRRRGRWTSSL